MQNIQKLRLHIFFKEQKTAIENSYDKKSFKYGIQSKVDNIYFQKLGSRYHSDDNLFVEFSNVSSNIAFKLKLTNYLSKNNILFDESYLSYKYKNNIFSVGRTSRWWSPSDNISLILSNSARPAPGIEIKNYVPIIPKRSIFKFIKTVNYEFL